MDPFVLRAAERILVVLAGAMCIYLGYRLFLKVPVERDADGHFKAPGGIEIVLSRVGPGVFFAVFGAIVLGLSFYFQVTYSGPDLNAERLAAAGGPVAAGSASAPAVSWSAMAPAATTSALDRQARLTELRGYMDLLNSLPTMLDPALGETDRRITASELRALRLKLMQAYWDAQLGDWEAFAAWARSDQRAAEAPAGVAEAAAIFHQGVRDAEGRP